MAVDNKRFKPDTRQIHAWLFLGIGILLMIVIGFASERSVDPVQLPVSFSPTQARLGMASFPDGWINGDNGGMTDKIRNAKRIALLEPTAFKRIAKIHQILSAFYSGLSVQDEERLAELIHQESLRYGYDPELIVSVILTESSFYKWAHSRKGAIGLMQINPVTGQALAEINRSPLYGTKALYDPRLNVKLGIQYLALLHQRFGDLGLALTAYNYGPTRVAEWRDRGESLPPGYTQKILIRYKHLLQEDPSAVLTASPDRAFQPEGDRF
ncbi:MAG: lytic transglycosylase domain-containing protein [Nitrospirae bacterium]|nr:lytic transglycosylase domain-containing protein [Nitrospirota bacterium]